MGADGVASPGAPVRCALFIDFDNIYLGLRRIDPNAAERFANSPTRLLDWIGGLLRPTNCGPSRSRSILVRKCYLNPLTFQKYRSAFTRCAFDVVDCPPLTRQGKTGADLRMMMDILDALDHPTHFDEFIILSGDADFTPVLLRLRSHDRRTVAFTAGFAAEAYRAACDLWIEEDVLVDEVFAVPAAPDPEPSSAMEPVTALPSPEPTTNRPLLDRMAGAVETAVDPVGSLDANALPRIYRGFPEFTPGSSWLGFHGLRALTEAVLAFRPRLAIENLSPNGDQWRVILGGQKVATESAGRGATRAAISPTEHEDELRGRVFSALLELVSESPTAVPMATAAQFLLQRVGDVVLRSRWLGAGSFVSLVLAASNPGFEIHTHPGPGYLIDPRRHQLPGGSTLADLATQTPELARWIERVGHVTGAPPLPPDAYRDVFSAISDVLSQTCFQQPETSKSVRDLLLRRGRSVSPVNISWVLRGLARAGHPLTEAPHSWCPLELARVFRAQVGTMCRTARLDLTTVEHRLLDDWLPGEVLAEDRSRAGERDCKHEESAEPTPPP